MSGNDFDGAAAFSGGGFMPPQSALTTIDPSPSTKNRDTQTLVPLTVNQINKALLLNDDKLNFLIDGVDVNNVKLVGMVMNKADRASDISFVLDDGTGRIDSIRWVQDTVDTKEMESINDGMYVRVHGQLKDFQGKKQLTVFGIKPVTDFDEITHHFVECIYVHSYNTKLMKQQASSNNQTHMLGSAVKTQAYQLTGATDGLKRIEAMVLEYMTQPENVAKNTGVHQEELAKNLGIPPDMIRAALDFWINEGMVYTVDEYHFKSIANG